MVINPIERKIIEIPISDVENERIGDTDPDSGWQAFLNLNALPCQLIWGGKNALGVPVHNNLYYVRADGSVHLIGTI